MKRNTIQTMVMAMLIAFISSYIVYFGFTTNYTTHSFSPQSFKEQYTHGVYKYRILSQYLLIHLDSFLENRVPSNVAERRLFIQDKHASERFYYSYYYLNTFFLILMSIALVLLLSIDIGINIPNTEKNLILLLVILLVSITQFVVCPYDISGYFFQLSIMFIFVKYFTRFYISSLISVCLLLVISTLNRESSALTISFLVVIVLCKWGLAKRTNIALIIWVSSFLITYFALRYFIKTPDPGKVTIDYLSYNLFFETNQIGILFWLLLFYFSLTIANSKENRALILAFHVVSLPYIWTCFTAGVLWEIRLYIPVFLGSLFLGKLDTAGFKIRLINFSRPSDIR